MNGTEKYLKTYHGVELLKKHRLTDTGVWEIRGEDPNCDMGGSHYEPQLDFVEGNLADVIAYAVNLKGFWNWGAGGRIIRITVKQVKDLANNALREERAALQARLNEIDNTLKG